MSVASISPRKAPISYLLTPQQVADYISGSTDYQKEAKLGLVASTWDYLVNDGEKQQLFLQFHSNFQKQLEAYYLGVAGDTETQAVQESPNTAQKSALAFRKNRKLVRSNSCKALSKKSLPVAPLTRSKSLRQRMPGESPHLTAPTLTVPKSSSNQSTVFEDSINKSNTAEMLRAEREKYILRRALKTYDQLKQSLPSAHHQLLVRFNIVLENLPESERFAHQLELEETEVRGDTYGRLKFIRDGEAYYQVSVPKYKKTLPAERPILTPEYCESAVAVAERKLTIAMDHLPILAAKAYIEDRRQQAENHFKQVDSAYGRLPSPFEQNINEYRFINYGTGWILKVVLKCDQVVQLRITQDEVNWMVKKLPTPKFRESLCLLCSEYVVATNNARFSQLYEPAIVQLGQALELNPNRQKLPITLQPYFQKLNKVMLGDIALMKFIDGPNFTTFRR
ncbi:hypothetical protein D5018_14305 [Parashewanella curva]|uniref:Uncharacterized protein n=1 Tax=Parashewanella curva TaxID=2338552 RepID=A0A3L8PX27_9GAMM|nr:hypothetical protein [Parashewanella curva]RLV58998.1 hypothetical protein D5018_14305 [Parashewanella curva]